MKIENIYIFGVGAAGSNILMNLIYALPDANFTVIDFDSVEMRNISSGTQPYLRGDLGKPKIQAIQRVVKMSNGKSISAVSKKITSTKDIFDIVQNFDNSIIIDCFDNANSRNLFHKISKNANIIHVGFSMDLSGEATWDESYEIMNDSKSDRLIDVCQMSIARPFITALASIASLNICHYFNNGVKISCFFDKSLNISKWN